MIGNKKLLILEFQEKTFLEKKSSLMTLLSKLPQDNQKVIDLLDIVNSINNSNNDDLLVEVFDIILDAIILVENNSAEKVGNMLEKAKERLVDMRKMEAEEKNETDLEDILTQLY
ncbi:MAG: hypothetical protein PHE25_03515 [Candidatus Gracilibacteria bacterium]|nr:hypothetical protein [Candidatus Gracilibacteria bacterium]